MWGDPWGREEVKGKKADRERESVPSLPSSQSGEAPPL